MDKHTFSVKRFALLLLLLGTAVQHVSADDQAPLFERWYVLTLQQRHVGWVHELVERRGDRIITTTTMQMSLSRVGMPITVTTTTTFTETAEGKPIEATAVQNLGAGQTVTTMRFGEDGIELITGSGVQRLTSKKPPMQEAWMPPAAAMRYLEQQTAKGAKQITLRRLDPSTGLVVVVEDWQYEGDENVAVMGKVVPATRWKVNNSLMPGFVAKTYLDAHGAMVRSAVALMPGMPLEVLQADEQLAMQAVDPPELLLSTLVKPDKPIANPRRLRSAIYELSFAVNQDGAAFTPDLPRGGSQRVIWGNNRTARVVINLDEPLNPIDDLPTAAHRDPSEMLNSNDPKIRKLVSEALPGGKGIPVARRAERLRRFVYRYIDAKNLQVGFATAGEVARTRQGDCSEHAVLLAAMLRAANVPSRTVSGLIYVDRFAGRRGVFGYHMWTQAWYGGDPGGGRWVDLDATLGNDTPFDATHIALGRSVLADDTKMNDMVNMASMIGRLSVRVISTDR